MPLDLPTISIVIPCYNSGAFIAQTLRSIVAQEYPRLELIVIDGGSTDDTVEIIKKFSNHITYFVSEPDKGQADAITKGFARASGDFIGWCNADDTYHAGALKAAGVALAQNPTADIVFGDKDYVDASGTFLFRAPALVPNIARLFPFPNIYSEAFLVRRELAVRVPINPQRHHLMDLDWFVRLYLDGATFLKANHFRANFRQHPDAKSSTQADVCHAESFQIALDVFNHPHLSADDRAHLVHSARLMLFNFWGEGDFPKLRAAITQARQTFGRTIYTPKLHLMRLLSFLPAKFLLGTKKLIRKVMTWLTWRWERAVAPTRHARPWRALPCLPSPVADPLRLVIQTRYPQTFANAVWGAFSLLRALDRRFFLTLVFNSALPPKPIQSLLHSIFPNLTLMHDYECLQGLQRRSPALERLAAAHPMGYKLATVFYFNAAAARNEKIIFADDDVMAFDRLDELIDWADDPTTATPLFLQEASTTTRHDPLFQKVAKRMGLSSPPLINVGLLALPAGAMSLEKLDALLEAVAAEQNQNADSQLSWFPDTSAIAFQLALGKGLPTDSYVVSNARQFWGMRDVDYSSIKLRHFVGPVRHLMRLRGVPFLLKLIHPRSHQ